MVHRLKRMVESKRLFFTPIAFSVPESAGLLDEQAEPDDGSGTGNRYKKKSFDWYKQVIATNGEDLG